jgi:hypothetical protein
MKKILIGLSLVSFLFAMSCGSEVGRLTIKPESGTIAAGTFPMTIGTVDFWTDYDIEYKGELTATYAITLAQGGVSVTGAECNPENVGIKMMSLITNFGESHSRRYQGKMVCSTKLPQSGPTDVKATFNITATGPYVVRKADLVLKQ